MLTAIDSETVPLPVPLAPLEMVSHGALLEAVHVHVGADAVTATDAAPPPDAAVWLVGEIVNVHGGGGGGGAPGCVTVTATPAIVSEPLRSPPLLAAAENVVVPGPVPEPPPVIAIHGALVVAVHGHVESDGVTAKPPVPPAVATDCVEGETLNVQVGGGGGGGGGGAAPWLIVNACPPIVTVPLRAAPLLAAALTVTLPLPVPLAADVIVIHGAFDVAVHAHDAFVAVSVVVVVAPSGGTVAFGGDSVKVHGGGAAVCVTVTVCPPTVIVPDRSPPPLAATLKGIEALPVPDEVPSAIHGAALDAAHAHVLCDAATVTVPLPPAAANDCGAALAVNVHGGGAPACVTANVWPAIVTMPLRSLVAVFAATSRRTVPLPLPFAPAPIVIHGVLDDDAHVQPAPAATDTVTDPPAATTLALVADSVKVHGGGGGGPGSGAGVGVGVGGGVGDGVGGATPACVTTTASPATLTVAVRDAVSAFAAARSVTDPLADALIGPADDSHGASLAAVHVQPFSVSIAIVTDPPAAGTDAFAGDTE